jgi:hypothetical protein
MTSRSLLAAACLLFVLGGTARAAELSSPTMVTAGTHTLWCNIVNISTVAQTVRIRIYDESGVLKMDSGNVVIAARATLWAALPSGRGHCRFTTVNAKTLFRASINVYDGGAVVESMPAQ